MSGFKCGIVGLPNVGKSTLFSALSGVAAEAANYPFCTVEPNIAMVEVPDRRIDFIAAHVTSEKLIPAVVEFVDIAGLIRGASKGEGLGNQFLGNIRNVDAIIQVVRCFSDDNIVHVEGKIDPLSDLETIETELALADLDVVQKRLANLEKKVKAADADAKEQVAAFQKVNQLLEQGKPARLAALTEDDLLLIKDTQLLTLKPQLYVANIGEDDLEGIEKNQNFNSLQKKAQEDKVELIPICAKIEAEVANLDAEERSAFLEELNIQESGLSRLIRSGYHLLGLRTYFTVGPKEIHAWTFPEGALAPQAAGKIHSDFEKGFIRAETYTFNDFEELKDEKAIKEAGRMRMEGKDYIVQDGDVMHFHFN